jgi:uncharacterized protein (DUF58 family)
MIKYPTIDEIKNTLNLDLLAKQTVEGFITGLHQSPFHGFSVEFAEHRIYNSGESTKHIDWKLFAKTDRLYTKRYEEETNLRCKILIDVSKSMLYPAHNHGKLSFGVFAASLIAHLLKKQRDAFGISLFAQEIFYQSPIKSTPSHFHVQLMELQRLLSTNYTAELSAVASAIENTATSMHRRSLIVLISDMNDNTDQTEKLFSALQHLKHNKHEVIIFHVLDKSTEIDFQFEERMYEFVDLESNEKVKLHPNQIRAYYQAAVKQNQEQLMLRCGQYKIDYIPCDINEGFENLMTTFLIKRNKMR